MLTEGLHLGSITCSLPAYFVLLPRPSALWLLGLVGKHNQEVTLTQNISSFCKLEDERTHERKSDIQLLVTHKCRLVDAEWREQRYGCCASKPICHLAVRPRESVEACLWEAFGMGCIFKGIITAALLSYILENGTSDKRPHKRDHS